jgi:tetratricopeptide (TPR) repeat protein
MGSCSRQFLGGKTSCARGKSHQVRWLCIKFFLLLVLSLYSSSAQTAKSDSAPDQLQQHYDAARTFQLSGDQEHAASEYKAFLVKALRSIANARVQMGELDAAAGLLDEVLRFTPDDEDVRLDYALVRLQQGNLPEARSLAEKVVQSSPTNAKAHALLGRILFDQRDYKAAQEQLEAAVIAAPNFDVGYLLGVTYIRLNDLSRARLLFDEMLTGLGDTAQLHLYFGRAYREGEWEALDNSIQEFKKALAKDSKLPEAHYFLALAYLVRDGESGFSTAVQELQAELKISPDDYRSHYLLGYIAMKSHDPKAAESELLRASSLESQNPDPLVFLGQLYADAGRDREAEVTVRKAIALTTDVSRNDYQINRAHYVLARILLRTGRQEEAENELAVSKELRDRVMHPELARNNKFAEFASPTLDNGAARPVVTAAGSSPEEQKKAQDYVSQLKPAIGEAYNNLGVIAAGRRDFVIAVDDFRKAAEWNPALESIDRNWGMAGFYAGQYNQAVAPLVRHLQTHEDDLRVRAALGLSYYTLGNYPQALETLRPIESQVNDDPGLSYAFAMSLVKTGDYTKGVARLRSLERANPNSAEVHTLLGEAFADQAEYGTALEEYRKALAIDPRQAQTHFLAGLALIHQGNPKDAAQELRLALALNPSNVSGKYHLAFALIQIQQKEEAASLLQEVLREDPKYVDAYYELGKMQLEKGDSKAAISSFEAGIKLSPESDHIHYQLAMAYRRESRTEDAEREIKLYQTLKNRRRGRDAAQPN